MVSEVEGVDFIDLQNDLGTIIIMRNGKGFYELPEGEGEEVHSSEEL